jgi:hypothetical protein
VREVQDDLVVDRSPDSSGVHCLRLADGADATFARLRIVDTLTSAERAIAARRLAAARPVVAALAGIVAPEAFWELCRDESRLLVAAGRW